MLKGERNKLGNRGKVKGCGNHETLSHGFTRIQKVWPKFIN
ncbi:hypothetical protein HanXRQr2_Chr02g0053971 [Helianthus annuus]|uniref:Uncharacterized protein n=1 Tax=Helianthus annuus TaxID=4232 RepID=A0A9K3NYT3_HELAN|nr:hypothetical protein HanXRQr2_Chr02g0053971 [Helianthus annuus]